ncbi:hypothetical protein KDW_46750 [Dictyobacter vulcani]|uniref:S1 motif domain-containing protein n=1 Tax=Dictyobacter vulcani TaxID=2607529 RepID=A0A5J4KS68_9CHLR|nr:S1 RNA-binding domain-containing protein [Dictyobacter vulcani]GER90513.1 hypothetical protein KDW_46750 [Dictyobacter vulcani]
MSDEQQFQDDVWLWLEEQYKYDRMLTGYIVELAGDHLIVDIRGIQGTVEHVTLGVNWRLANLTIEEQQLSEEELVYQQLTTLQGQEIGVRILDMDRYLHILSLELSGKAEVTAQQKSKEAHILTGLRPGDICKGRVKSIYGHQVKVELGGIEGTIPPDHISLQKSFIDPWKVVQPGQEVEVMIMDKDPDNLLLSLTYAQRRDEALHKLKADTICEGSIASLSSDGIYVDLGGVLGLVPVEQVVSGYITHPADRYHKGQHIVVRIQQIASDKRVTASLVSAE